MADLLKMKHEDPVFQRLLHHFPFDDQWDLEDQVESAYAHEGLKRFSVDTCLGLKKRQKVESEEKTFSSTASSGSKDKALADCVNPRMPDVKLEVKELAVLRSNVEIIKSAEKKFSNMIADLKPMKASLAALNKPESQNLMAYEVLRFSLLSLCPSTISYSKASRSWMPSRPALRSSTKNRRML